MATNYLIQIRVQYPSGTNLANINATLRNEHTNESETLTSNASGEIIWNVGNLPSGFAVGDNITVFALYQGFQQSFAFEIPSLGNSVAVKDNSGVSIGTATAGGLGNGVLILVAVPTAPSLRYFTVQEFLDHFNMRDYSADAENGIKTQPIVLIGQGIELEIDNLTRTKFDSNSGAYYSVIDEYHDARFERQNNYYLKSTPVISMTKFEITQNSEGTNELTWKNLVHDQIDALDATTGWTATTDGSVTLNSTPSQISEGSAALNLVKSGATTAAVTYSNTLSTSYDFFDRSVYVDYYISDNTNLAATDAIAFRFGTSSSNYYEQTYDRSQLASAAWNTLSFRRDDTGVTVTGSPGTSALSYFAIVVTTTASTTTIAAPDQRLDDLRLNEKNRINIDTDTGRVRITDSGDYAGKGKRHIRATYTYGRASVPADIKVLGILWTGQLLLGASFLRARINDKGGPTEAQLDWFESYKQMIINKYRNPVILPT